MKLTETNVIKGNVNTLIPKKHTHEN